MAWARHAMRWLGVLALLGAVGSGLGAERPELRVTSVLLGRRPGDGRMLLAVRGQWLKPGALWKYQVVYWRGRELLFEQRGERAFVAVDGEQPQLASFLVETPGHRAELQRLLAGGARGFAVVVTGKSAMLAKLPALPPGRQLALAALYCYELDVGALAAQTGVESLKIADVNDGSDLSPLAAMKGLRNLTIYRSRRVKWSTLAKLTQLEALALDDCGNNCDLAAVAKLPGLVSLRVSGGSGQPRKSQALRGMTRLRRLSLRSWRGLGDLSLVAPLTRLEGLELTQTDAADLSPLAGLTQLRWLSLAYSGRLKDLTPLLKLRRLASLSLMRCERVTSLATVAKMTGLRELDLSYCDGFSDLSPLASLTRLKRLDLSHCRGVRNLEPLKAMVRAGTEVVVGRQLQKQLEALRKTDF